MKVSATILFFFFNLFFLSSKAQFHYRRCTLPATSIVAMRDCIDKHPNFGYFVLQNFPYENDNSFGLIVTAYDKNMSPIDLKAPIIDHSIPTNIHNYVLGSFIITLQYFNDNIDGKTSIDFIPEEYLNTFQGVPKTFLHYRLVCNPSCQHLTDPYLNPSPPAGSN